MQSRDTSRRDAVASSALLWLTVTVFAPGQIVYGNHMDFPMAFGSLLPSLLAAAAIGTLASSLLILALPWVRARRVAVALVFALGVLAWIQGTFLLWDYGVLDGRPIDWTAHRWHGLVDAAVWGLGLTACLAAWRYTSRIAGVASLMLVVVQGGSLAIQAARLPDRWVDHAAFDDSGRFAFSRDRNAVIVVLDAFQTDLFQELLDEDPSLAARFRGFTYFRNATAGFSGTPASITLLLTGQQYDNAVPFQQFVKTAFLTRSLPRTLKQAGFHVYYNHPYFWSSLYADPSIASHVTEITSWPTRGGLAPVRQLMTLGLFRSGPQALKRRMSAVHAVYMAPLGDDDGLADHLSPAVRDSPRGRKVLREIPWRVGDAPFFREAALLVSPTLDQPAFKYYHLLGVHPPITYDDELQPRSAPFTRETARRQAKGLIKLVQTFFATLEMTGSYDNTMLAIVGDHGAMLHPRVATPEIARMGGDTAAPTSKSYGLPLVLIKPIAATGPLVVSDRPVSLVDIPKTIASGVGIASELPGQSMFEPSTGTPRPRRVLAYPSGIHRLAHEYFPTLTEFEVTGFSWFEQSWRPTGRQFAPGSARSAAPAASYAWGRTLQFGSAGDAGPFLGDGWGAAEPNLRWTVGRSARLRFAVPPAGTDVVLRAQVAPALVGPVREQRVEIYVGRERVTEWSVRSPGEYTATIAKALVSNGELEVLMVLPDAVVPRDVVPALLDERELALAVARVTLEPVR